MGRPEGQKTPAEQQQISRPVPEHRLGVRKVQPLRRELVHCWKTRVNVKEHLKVLVMCEEKMVDGTVLVRLVFQHEGQLMFQPSSSSRNQKKEVKPMK